MARSADHPHVVYEVFAAELGADTALPADLEDFLFPLQVAEAASSFVTRGGQLVEVTCRSLLDGRQTHFGRRAADADGQVVGRAGRGAEIHEFRAEKFQKRFLVQQRFGLLVEEGFVGGAAAFGDEQEFVFVAFVGVEIDLCGQVRARVLLLGHREGHHLRIAQVALLVGFVGAPGDTFGVVRSRKDILALLADADGRAGVLAGRQFAFGGDRLVEQHGVGHEFIVVGSFRILQNVAESLQMGRAQVERYVGIGFAGQQFDTFGIDLENAASVAFDDLDILFGQQTILRLVTFDREWFLIDEFRHGVEVFIVALEKLPIIRKFTKIKSEYSV